MALVGGLPACSLFVSLDDLSGGPGSDGGLDGFVEGASAADSGPSDGGFPDAQPRDSGDAGFFFFDDFNRADDILIGNGWISKSADAFSLRGGMALRSTANASEDFADNLVYRPPAQDIRDVAISVELTYDSAANSYPQAHARVQEATVASAGIVDSYLFYIEGTATTAVLARTRSSEQLSDLVDITLTPNLVAGERYRLRFEVQGANPVSLHGVVEHYVPPDWVSIGEGNAIDSDPMRIDGQGTFGFSASQADTDRYAYDNFTVTAL